MTGPWDIDQVPERYVDGAEDIVLLALDGPTYQLHLQHEAFLHVTLANAIAAVGDQAVQWTICETFDALPDRVPFVCDADLSLFSEDAQGFFHGMVFGAICALRALAETNAARYTDGS